jgi:alkanesulfonate monooxygenase SsuD/methylene tetrahydromethanopterin reductase-like flavin-dependent oxidoreductase (luciferase family)
VNFPKMTARPKPVQRPHPPVIVGGAFRLAARRALRYGDGILPQGPAAGSGDPEEFLPRWREMVAAAGRDPRSLSVTLGTAPEDLDRLRRLGELGVDRVTVRLPAAASDEILPVLDRWARLIRRLAN